MNKDLFGIRIDRRLIAKTIVTTMIVLGWLSIEMYNMGTTWAAINQIFGEKTLILNVLLIVGIVAIDFGGLTRIAMPRTHQDEKYWTMAMGLIWFVIAMINAAFTWWNASMDLSTVQIATPHGVSAANVVLFVPICIAGIIFVVRVGMMLAFGQMLDSWLGGSPRRTGQIVRPAPVNGERNAFGSQPQAERATMAAYPTISSSVRSKRNGTGVPSD
jgi:hypothetical protein